MLVEYDQRYNIFKSVREYKISDMMSRKNVEKYYEAIPETIADLEDRCYANSGSGKRNNRQQLPSLSGYDQSSNASCSGVEGASTTVITGCSNGGKFFGRNLVFSEFWHNHKSNVIYENLCENCGYGVFRAHGKLCEFCRYAVNGHLKEENIYENICENCGEICSGIKCELCLNSRVKLNDPPLEKPKKSDHRNNNRLFGGIFDTIKKARSSRDKFIPSQHSTAKSKKLEIVHNVDSVFRTNETFDLNRICELKRQQSNSDNHIYGKLRKSDDQLMSSYNYETIRPKTVGNSKSDPSLHKIQNITPTQHQRLSAGSAITTNKPYKTDKKNPKQLKTIDKKVKQSTRSYYQQQTLQNDHVIDWMTSIRRQTCEYFTLTDDSICNTKSIPSRNFSCCGQNAFHQNNTGSYQQVSFLPSSSSSASSSTTLGGGSYSSGFYASTTSSRLNQQFLGSDRSLHSILSNDLDYIKLINQFKRNLMEKQRSKRRAIYVKTDDIDASITRSIVSGSGITLRTATSALNIDKLKLNNNNNNSNNNDNLNYFNKTHNRYGYCETPDSDFVTDILSVFDSFVNQRHATPETQSDIASSSTTANVDNISNSFNGEEESNKEVIDEYTTNRCRKRQQYQHSHHQSRHEVKLENQKLKTDTRTREVCLDGSQVQTIAESVNDDHVSVVRNISENDRRFSVLSDNLHVICKPSDQFIKGGKLIEFYLDNIKRVGGVIVPRLPVKNFLNKIIISKSLNRILIFYDRNLSDFLSLISLNRDFYRLDREKLHRLYCLMINSNLNSQMKVSDRVCDRGAFVKSNAIQYKSDPNKCSDPDIVKISKMTITADNTDDHIYQPIWKFQTVGNAPETSSLDYYDRDMSGTPIDDGSTASLSHIEDHGEWETDDEFMFTTKLKDFPEETQSEIIVHETTSLSSMNPEEALRRQNNDPYQKLCIFYSETDPKVRGIVYDYDPRRSYFSSHHHRDKDRSNKSLELYERIYEEIKVPSQSTGATPKNNNARELPKTWIPDSVHAWKFMLLGVNYLDDEEHTYISEDEILKLKESDPGTTLHKSKSTGNLLEIPRGKKKSIGERVRNKLNRGVLKISSRIPKDKKDKEYYKTRNEVTSFYIDTDIKPKCPIFGAKLDEVEKYFYDYDVPQFIADCIAIIEQKEFVQSEGLYRASGNKTAIDDVKKKLIESPIYDTSILKDQEVHTVTGLLKLFFRELKTPLIPDELYCKLPENLVDKSSLTDIKSVLEEIPSVSRGTLKFLLKHLTMVASHSGENRMPASNLAIIWGPCLLYSPSRGPFDIARSNTLTKILIENYDVLFGDDERLVN